jgi:hypothetical protein
VKPLRERGAARRYRFKDADIVTRCGEQISNAVAHQTAADHAYFPLGHLHLNAK